jgi:hypothetical protein
MTPLGDPRPFVVLCVVGLVNRDCEGSGFKRVLSTIDSRSLRPTNDRTRGLTVGAATRAKSHLRQPQPGNLRHGKGHLDDVSVGGPRVEWASTWRCTWNGLLAKVARCAAFSTLPQTSKWSELATPCGPDRRLQTKGWIMFSLVAWMREFIAHQTASLAVQIPASKHQQAAAFLRATLKGPL